MVSLQENASGRPNDLEVDVESFVGETNASTKNGSETDTRAVVTLTATENGVTSFGVKPLFAARDFKAQYRITFLKMTKPNKF